MAVFTFFLEGLKNATKTSGQLMCPEECFMTHSDSGLVITNSVRITYLWVLYDSQHRNYFLEQH
jgi:hypothetical protein